ncbi:MAG: glycosyl hydrolase [Candidatus Hydrogenedentota bacterium]
MKKLLCYTMGAFAFVALTFVALADPVEWVKGGLITQGEADEGFVPIFNGKDLNGWWIRGENKDAYYVKDGNLVVTGKEGGDWIFTNEEYGDFVLRYEYRCVSGEGNSGVGIRAPKEGNPAFDGFEIQVIRAGWETPYQRAGALYSVVPPKVEADKPFGEWNSVEILCAGARVRTLLNGQELYDIKVTDYTKDTETEEWQKPADTRPLKGFIGLQDHSDEVWFRNLRVKALPDTAEVDPPATTDAPKRRDKEEG